MVINTEGLPPIAMGLAKKFARVFVTSYRKTEQRFWPTQYLLGESNSGGRRNEHKKKV